jgi:hypothetical protein
MRPDELERRLRERLGALGPASLAELLHVLMLPDFDRADRIGEFGVTRRAAPSPSADRLRGGPDAPSDARRDVARRRGQVASSRKDGGTMNRLMRPTLLAFVISLVVWGLIAVWDADPRAVSSWLLTWQRIAIVVAIVSGLVMVALLVYAAWERLSR